MCTLLQCELTNKLFLMEGDEDKKGHVSCVGGGGIEDEARQDYQLVNDQGTE